LCIGGLMALGMVFVLGVRALVRETSWAGALAASVILGAAAQLLALDYASLRHATVVGMTASFVLGVGIVSMVRKGVGLPVGVCAACAIVCGAALLQSHLFGQAEYGPSVVYIAIVVLAPWCGVLAKKLTRSLGEKRPIVAKFVIVIGVLIPLGAGVGLSARKSILAETSDDPYAMGEGSER
jgi:hypothetical protein